MIDRIKALIRLLKGPVKCAIEGGAHIGKGFSHNGGVSFGSEPYLITIKDNVRLSANVSFITHDGGNWAFRHDEPYNEVNHFGKIVVDEYTFIGAGATIMPGVYIGKHCVIGAGAVVTKSIPDYSVAVGIPAKVINTTYEYAEKMKNQMPTNWDVVKYKADKRKYLEEVIEPPQPVR